MSAPSPFSLAGKAALVVGASRGIGLAIAQAMAAAGAEAMLAARSLGKCEERAAALREAGLRARAIRLDVADAASIRETAASLPDIDVLVNVAGTNIRKRFQDYSQQDYDYLLQTNLHGIVELTKRVGARMVERGKGGKVVNIGSLLSVAGLPYMAPYAITKSALAGLTRALAAEWGRHGIQVNCIAPGFILTDLNRAMWEPEAMRQWMRASQSIPRLGTPEDVAPLAVFLASPGSDYITGQVIPVDGGFTTTANWPFEP